MALDPAVTDPQAELHKPGLANGSARSLVLRGAAKASIILLALGQERASRLVQHFNADELRRISRSAADIGPVSAPQLESLVEDFARQFAGGVKFFGTQEELEKLFIGAFSEEQIAEIAAGETTEPVEMDGIEEEAASDATGSVWEQLANVPETDLAAFVEQEHPQVGTFIISHLSPETSANLLNALPEDLHGSVLRRFLKLGEVSSAVSKLAEHALRESLLVSAESSGEAGPRSRLAEIINRMDKEMMDRALQSLSEYSPEDFKILKSMLFTFEDLGDLQPDDCAALFGQVPTDEVVLALQGADEAIKEIALSSLGTRARRMVESELASGEANPKDIQAARRSIAARVLTMIAEGDIQLTGEEDSQSSEDDSQSGDEDSE